MNYYQKTEIFNLPKSEADPDFQIDLSDIHLTLLLNNEIVQDFFGLTKAFINKKIDNGNSQILNLNLHFKNAEKMEQFNYKDIEFINSLANHLESNYISIISCQISHISGELNDYIYKLSLNYILSKDINKTLTHNNVNSIKKF